MSTAPADASLLDKLDSIAPAGLKQFDAFPKLPSTYQTRSESRGFLTILVSILAFLLVLNDIGEFIWGWPDYEFSVDRDNLNAMKINVDMVVNMPCAFLSVDLRDAVGDRLYLSNGFRRDGTLFDVGQATTLKAHSAALSARQVVAQSRRSRGFFASLLQWTKKSDFQPTYNYKPSNTACRVYGSLDVKKVTANLHITTLGHGYASAQHVPHDQMNLSHVITEFSFGPYFPDITQPLDYSFETTNDPFVAYQYFLTVVPTTYIAPRTAPLSTNQYSVTHYTRVLEHNRGTPGIFFKFDLDPISLTIHQRTTTFVQLIIRCVGVIGGVWVCMGWAIKVGSRAVDVVSGADRNAGIVAAEATGARKNKKWGGGELRARTGARTHSGNWIVEGGSAYSSYAGTPVGSTFSPYAQTPPPMSASSPNGMPGLGVGLSPNTNSFGPGHTQRSASFSGPPSSGLSLNPDSSHDSLSTAATAGSLYAPQHTRSPSASPYFPPTPSADLQFPSSPAPQSAGFPHSPAPQSAGFQSSPGPQSATFPRSPATPSFGSTPPTPGSPFDRPGMPRRETRLTHDGKLVPVKKTV